MGADTKLIHAGLLSGHRLCGCRVVTSEGENLGRIEDIIIDEEQGHVVAALVSVGGFLGVGTKFFAFPWAALHHDRVEKQVILNVDPDSLRDAPGFDPENWP